MELTPLRYFRAVAVARHMTRAARVLGVTQPALSAAIRKLEGEVGAPLLHRTGRGVELTEAGRVFLRHAEEALRHADSARSAVRELLGLEAGTIRVGGGATAIASLLPPVVSALRRAHPGLRYFVREAGSTQVAASVLAGELDLGIVTLPVTLPESDRLAREPLVDDELRLILPAGVALGAPPARGRPRPARTEPAPPTFRWSDLSSRPVVGFEAGSAVRNVIDSAAARAGVTLDYVMELRSIESIRRMVRAGVGVGFVSRFALAADEGLVCADARLARRLAMVTRRGQPLSPAARTFAAALVEHAKKAR